MLRVTFIIIIMCIFLSQHKVVTSAFTECTVTAYDIHKMSFMLHRMHEIRPFAIDDPVAWSSASVCLSVTRATIRQMAPRSGHYYIAVATCSVLVFAHVLSVRYLSMTRLLVIDNRNIKKLSHGTPVAVETQRPFCNVTHDDSTKHTSPHVTRVPGGNLIH